MQVKIKIWWVFEKKKIVSLNFDLVLVTHEFVKYLKLENE